jgi:hypothetical protein
LPADVGIVDQFIEEVLLPPQADEWNARVDAFWRQVQAGR